MGVGSIKPTDGLSEGQMAGAEPTDSVSKDIQNEIMNAQRQMQELSSKEDISAEEKMKKRQELRQEISNLNTQLRRHQAELSRQQRKAAMTENAQAEKENAQAEKENVQAKEDTAEERKDTGNGMSRRQMQAIAVTDSSMERTRRQEMVIARIEGGIAILQGEISQDEVLGMDTERKREELDKQQEKVLKATASRFSALGESRKAMKEAAQDKISGEEGNAGSKAKPVRHIEELGPIGATNFMKQKNRAQQKLFPFLDIRG